MTHLRILTQAWAECIANGHFETAEQIASNVFERWGQERSQTVV